jgi:hypothetical protein
VQVARKSRRLTVAAHVPPEGSESGLLPGASALGVFLRAGPLVGQPPGLADAGRGLVPSAAAGVQFAGPAPDPAPTARAGMALTVGRALVRMAQAGLQPVPFPARQWRAAEEAGNAVASHDASVHPCFAGVHPYVDRLI